MAISVEWGDAAQTIIYEVVTNPWSWEDAAAARSAVLQLALSKSYASCLIVEVASDVSLPPGGFPAAMQDAVTKHRQAGLARIIYVLHNPGLIPMWESALHAFGADLDRYALVRTMQAAYDEI